MSCEGKRKIQRNDFFFFLAFCVHGLYLISLCEIEKGGENIEFSKISLKF